MEIALVLVLGFVAYIYFSAERPKTALHKTFSVLLIAVPVHLLFDALTLYTVNHLDTVPKWLNDALHRVFIGTMVLVVYLFYQYIAILVEEETGKPRRLDLAARIYLAAAEAGVLVLPVHYAVTALGNYSDGIHADVCYASVAFYLLLCVGLLLGSWKGLERKKRFAIGAALVIELSVSVLQGFHPTWLISGMGITLMTLAFYLTLENPDILRSELSEQKLSMLYLKSQVNPHFLYNTLAHSGAAERRCAGGAASDAARRLFPAQRQGRPAHGDAGRRICAHRGVFGAHARALSVAFLHHRRPA